MELRALGQGSGCTSSGCGGSADKLAHLPEAIRAKINNHPCFSEDAHHHHARMHVAVAPACNIQCHYCNRKYDCSNESRPTDVRFIGARKVDLYCAGGDTCGDAETALSKTIRTLEGCEPWGQLEADPGGARQPGGAAAGLRGLSAARGVGEAGA